MYECWHLLSNTYSKVQGSYNPASKNGVESISSFNRRDKLHTSIVSNLCYNMRNACGRYKARWKDIAKENKEKNPPLVPSNKINSQRKTWKKKNAHRNKLTKSDLTLWNSVTNASKVTIAAKASNSTSFPSSRNSTSIANSSNSAISASASSTVISIVSQGETLEETCTATVSPIQKIISKPQGLKRKLKQVDLSSFFKKRKLWFFMFQYLYFTFWYLYHCIFFIVLSKAKTLVYIFYIWMHLFLLISLKLNIFDWFLISLNSTEQNWIIVFVSWLINILQSLNLV